MKHPLFKALCGLSLMALCHCGGGGGTDDCCSDNTPSSSVCAETTTWTSSIALATAASVVTSATQDYNLIATANKKIAAYLINESSIEPSGTDAGWTPIIQTTDLSATNITHVLADTADGEKTVYAWFKDECGGISNSANVNFTLDATAPAGTLLLDSGAKFTLESDLDVTAILSATDADGIVAYALTVANAEPEVDSTDWVSVASTTSLSISTTRTLPHGDRANTVYGWVKDVAGHVSAVSDEIEVMRVLRDTGPINAGTYTSIAVDSNDIAYFTCYYFGLGIMSLNYESISLGDAIDNDPIDPFVGFAGDLGKGTSIAIDASDKIHIAYRDEDNGKLKYATNASGNWVSSTIEDGGLSPNIDIDSLGFAHIVHQTGTDVRYVTNKSGGWVGSSIYTDANVNYNLKMRMDDTDGLHVLYATQALIPDKIVYLTNVGGSWTNETVLTFAGAATSQPAINLSGSKLIVSYSYADGKFYYIEKGLGASWSNPQLIDSRYGLPSALAADSDGVVHVIYYATATHDLVYATNASGAWLNKTIDEMGSVGAFNDIAVDTNNRLHISYYDTTRTVLVYATTADAP